MLPKHLDIEKLSPKRLDVFCPNVCTVRDVGISELLLFMHRCLNVWRLLKSLLCSTASARIMFYASLRFQPSTHIVASRLNLGCFLSQCYARCIVYSLPWFCLVSSIFLLAPLPLAVKELIVQSVCLSVCVYVCHKTFSNCCFSYSFSSTLARLCTHDLCANVHKSVDGTDFQNFDLKIFGNFLKFQFGLSLWNSSSGAV